MNNTEKKLLPGMVCSVSPQTSVKAVDGKRAITVPVTSVQRSADGKMVGWKVKEGNAQRAKALLSDDTLTISAIGQNLGFKYPQHFVRFFKGLTGKTPAQWRAA